MLLYSSSLSPPSSPQSSSHSSSPFACSCPLFPSFSAARGFLLSRPLHGQQGALVLILDSKQDWPYGVSLCNLVTENNLQTFRSEHLPVSLLSLRVYSYSRPDRSMTSLHLFPKSAEENICTFITLFYDTYHSPNGNTINVSKKNFFF